jgi:DNA-binding CsgD family transcriptional regulator
LAEAEADGRTAWEIYASSAGGTWLPLSYLDVLVERDRAQEAWELIGRDVLLGSAQRTATTELVRARVQIALGRGDGAVLDTLLATGRELDEMRFLHPQFMPWRAIAAQLAAELGESELARGLADEVLELGHRSECPTSISQGLRIHGGLHGDRDALAEAVQTAAPTADRLEHARALTALGTAELEAGATAQARETLRAALATAHDAGALRLANQARAALIAAGGRPRRAALTGIDALTPSELQVARLAADGLTNRDIADTLFVAVKTVEQHLARAYSKLEIPGRAALTEALTR